MRITSVDEAASLLRSPNRGGFTHVVSIGDADCPPPCDLEALKIPYLRMEFHDIHFLDDNWIPPKCGEVNRLINCLKLAPEEANILFHCHLGRSRSGAAGLIHLYLKLKSEDAAVRALLEARPIARPNRLVLVLADAILSSNLRTTMAAALGIHDGWYLRPPVVGEFQALEVPGY